MAPRARYEPCSRLLTGAPSRTRTCGLLLRRQSLYPLSYRGQAARTCAAAGPSLPAGVQVTVAHVRAGNGVPADRRAPRLGRAAALAEAPAGAAKSESGAACSFRTAANWPRLAAAASSAAAGRRWQGGQGGGDRVEAAALSGAHQGLARAGRGEGHGPAVGRVRLPRDKAGGDQAFRDPGHRRAGDALGGGHGAESARSAEHEDRQRGQPRRGEARLGVNRSQVAQQVDRGGGMLPISRGNTTTDHCPPRRTPDDQHRPDRPARR